MTTQNENDIVHILFIEIHRILYNIYSTQFKVIDFVDRNMISIECSEDWCHTRAEPTSDVFGKIFVHSGSLSVYNRLTHVNSKFRDFILEENNSIQGALEEIHINLVRKLLYNAEIMDRFGDKQSHIDWNSKIHKIRTLIPILDINYINECINEGFMHTASSIVIDGEGLEPRIYSRKEYENNNFRWRFGN